MKTTSSRYLLSSLFIGAVAVAGCSSAASDGGGDTGDEQDVVPASAKTLFDQAGVCDNVFKRHAAIRDSDMRDGLLRWECGDVPGVTGPDLGQEYCEYHASSGGKLVKAAKDLAQAQKLSCVFTGVYADVKDDENRDGSWGTETSKYAKTLATAMTDKSNLGVATDPNLLVM